MIRLDHSHFIGPGNRKPNPSPPSFHQKDTRMEFKALPVLNFLMTRSLHCVLLGEIVLSSRGLVPPGWIEEKDRAQNI
jgi:hypothetical protein